MGEALTDKDEVLFRQIHPNFFDKDRPSSQALLTDKDEVLFRQIHPNFFDKDRPSSQAFKPTSKDNNKLSVDRSSLTTAEKAYALYMANGNHSQAVYGLSVGEFENELLPCVSDPVQANLAHAYADYSNYGASQQKIKAKLLKRRAIKRGCLYPPC